MYYARHISRSSTAAVRIVCLLLAAALTAALAEWRVRTVAEPIIERQAKNLCTQAINEALLSVLSENNSESFICLMTGDDGLITAVETDSVSVNRFKSQVSAAVQSNIASLAREQPTISIGSLSGLRLLAGKGADISLDIVPDGAVTAELVSALEQAGINQTRHTVTCVVRMDMYAAAAGMRTRVTVETSVMIAESVIVGEVPDSFTYVVGDKADTIGRIFDYGDPYGNE